MVNLWRNLILAIFYTILVGCIKIPDTEIDTSYTKIEKEIRSEFDKKAVFSWDQYKEFLQAISNDKFVVLPLNEMRDHYYSSKVVIGLRHDVDNNPFKALEMATIENHYSIRATYFIRATADYYGYVSRSHIIRYPAMCALYRQLSDAGAEIGIHNDLLTMMILYGIDPYSFTRDELAFYKSLKIPVYGTASHGSLIAKNTVPNYQIFSDFAKKDSVKFLNNKFPLGIKSLRDFGFKYEAYFIDFKYYYSDSGGKWNDPEGFQGILKKLVKSKPGDRIEILIHPEWWGKPEIQ